MVYLAHFDAVVSFCLCANPDVPATPAGCPSDDTYFLKTVTTHRRGDAAPVPGAALGRTAGHARFVLEADERAGRRPEGSTSCQVASRHAVIVSSSRSAAGRAGICTL
jgi:hypothetical protein